MLALGLDCASLNCIIHVRSQAMSTDTESRIEGDGYYALWRRNDLAVINRELAQRVVDRARLFEDGLLDLFQTVVAIFDLRWGQFAREGVGIYDQRRVDVDILRGGLILILLGELERGGEPRVGDFKCRFNVRPWATLFENLLRLGLGQIPRKRVGLPLAGHFQLRRLRIGSYETQ